MYKKILAALFICSVMIICAVGFTACGNVDVTKVELNKTVLSLTVGDEETLTATVTPDDATDKTVTWETSDSSIATVVDGKVTAVSVGSATVTAKAGDKTATCSVTVNAPVPVKMTETEWKAYLDKLNAATSWTIKGTMTSDSETQTVNMAFDGSKNIFYQETDSYASYAVFDKTNLTATYYYGDKSESGDTVWTKDVTTYDDEASFEVDFKEHGIEGLTGILYDAYDELTFDETTNSYAYTYTEEIDEFDISFTGTYTITFENGELKSVKIDFGGYSVLYEFSDVNAGKTITIPDEALNASENA